MIFWVIDLMATDMDLGQLRYFNKIVEHRSFTRAAKDCSVSQPALSQQIAKLEKELGQPLFERQGRTIRMTPAGQVLQNHAQKILQLVEDAKRQITDDGQSGQICISATPTIAPYFFPELLNGVTSQFPKADFSLVETNSDSLIQLCLKGDLDVGVLAISPLVKQSANYLSFETLLEEELLLAIPAQHPLCRKSRIHLKDLALDNFLMLPANHSLTSTLDNFFHRKKFHPGSITRVQQLATLQSMITSGYGVSLVPKMAARDDSNKIVYRSLSGDQPRREIALCWNSKRYQSELLSNFLKALIEFAGNQFSSADTAPVEPLVNAKV
ncbi:LysR family transcriptional regulator [Mariniblastus sp.]|jgi:LysR family hydrogen peroxide-inducible transcriptional activator|nr:LysR family transcriptional regulator [Mariniblastus sp.]MDB4386192.1 LysR family transcriptional regulator [bacterium]